MSSRKSQRHLNPFPNRPLALNQGPMAQNALANFTLWARSAFWVERLRKHENVHRFSQGQTIQLTRENVSAGAAESGEGRGNVPKNRTEGKIVA